MRYLITFLVSFSFSMLFGQTTGPTQPEAAGFTPIESSNMVNLYTGDFNYNIPLMIVPGPDGGYPINLFYNSNIGMESAASWVGLGWNLNCGSITRNLRGLPDDFKGDEVEKTVYMKPSLTIGVGVNPKDLEIFGGQINLEQEYQIYYNNYGGLGLKAGLSMGPTNEVESERLESIGISGVNFSNKFSFSTCEGVELSPSISISKSTMDNDKDCEGENI